MADTRQAYEAWHLRYGVDHESDAPWHCLVKLHVDPLRDIAGKHILEIGCGRGGFACWLASLSPQPASLVAADFARTAVGMARRHADREGIRRIRWEVADITEVGHPSGTFDTVFCCETIEHVTTPWQALGELARVLRPGGRLYVTTPNYLGPMGLHRLYRLAGGRSVAEEGQPLSHGLLLPQTLRWIRRAGLEVAVVDATGYYLPFPGRPPIRLDRLERFRWLRRWLGLHTLVVGTKRHIPEPLREVHLGHP